MFSLLKQSSNRRESLWSKIQPCKVALLKL